MIVSKPVADTRIIEQSQGNSREVALPDTGRAFLTPGEEL
jgi:hypothetical protein